MPPRKTWEGWSFLSGIPGNSWWSYQDETQEHSEKKISDYIETVTFMNHVGDIETRTKENLIFSYRNLSINPDETVIGCNLALFEKNDKAIKSKIRKYALERSLKQPIEKATAGSVFMNPPGDSAGRLIEESGLKGMQVGHAKISEKHANFIENLGEAKATDILALIEMIKDRVFQKFGIQLELEVEIVGECSCNGIKVLN